MTRSAPDIVVKDDPVSGIVLKRVLFHEIGIVQMTTGV